jgi:lipopolysaccharide biosynthesis glycosyltransferase
MNADTNLYDEVMRVRQRIHDLSSDVVGFREKVNMRIENIMQVEDEQNESIKKMAMDIREFREDKLRKEGASRVWKFFQDNWFKIVLCLLIIFSLLNEEKILHLIR